MATHNPGTPLTPFNPLMAREDFSIPFVQPSSRLMPAQTVDGSFRTSGKTVIITGGSQGIGRATALLFSRKGYNVVVAARDLSKLQYVAHDCSETAGRQGSSLAVQCDVTSDRDVRNLAYTVAAKYDSIDVVVNCAGVVSRGKFVDTPLEEARKLMEVNYLGAYSVAQAFLPILIKQAQRKKGIDRPSLVMIGSFAGKVPLKYMSAFSASKYALDGFTDAIRSEVEPLGVHIGQVHPGLVKSNFMERAEFFGQNAEDERRSFRQTVRSLPFSQTPQEVADTIFNCYASKQGEAMVGLPFMAAGAAFRMTGLNVSAVPFL